MGRHLMLVLDTSALVYWSFNPDSLSEKARAAILGADSIVISSITLWEIALKHKRQRLVLPMEPFEFVRRLESVSNLSIVPIAVSTWLCNVALDWEHADPADRTIVATAIERSCPLVSSDRQIREFYSRAIW